MQPEAQDRLQHILQAGETIQEFTAGKTYADYEQSLMLRLAVERLFTIIGEALAVFIRLEPSLATSVSGYRDVVDFRNVLTHAYLTIDDEVVWNVIQKDLPRLLAEVRHLLNAA
jgi:uncharacterized protein with HEPN domain